MTRDGAAEASTHHGFQPVHQIPLPHELACEETLPAQLTSQFTTPIGDSGTKIHAPPPGPHKARRRLQLQGAEVSKPMLRLELNDLEEGAWGPLNANRGSCSRLLPPVILATRGWHALLLWPVKPRHVRSPTGRRKVNSGLLLPTLATLAEMAADPGLDTVLASVTASSDVDYAPVACKRPHEPEAFDSGLETPVKRRAHTPTPSTPPASDLMADAPITLPVTPTVPHHMIRTQVRQRFCDPLLILQQSMHHMRKRSCTLAVWLGCQHVSHA